jgi:hypothetical protein
MEAASVAKHLRQAGVFTFGSRLRHVFNSAFDFPGVRDAQIHYYACEDLLLA